MKPTAVMILFLCACSGSSPSEPAAPASPDDPARVLRGLDAGDVVSVEPQPEPDAGSDAATVEPEPDAGSDGSTPDAGSDAGPEPGPACTGMHLAVCTGASCATVCNVYVPGIGNGIACCNDPNYPGATFTYWCDCP